MLVTLIVLLPFIGSVAAAFLPANARNFEAALARAVAAGCTLLVVSMYPDILDGGVERVNLPWLPQFGPNRPGA